MTKFHFALTGAAALALAACGSQDEDTLADNVDNAQLEELNGLADNAALDAEMEALGNQQQQLDAGAAANDTPAETGDDINTEPSEVEDNVAGM